MEMESLFSHMDSILHRIREKSHCVLCLDYDGTLTPIVERPEKALLHQSVRDAIAELNHSSFFTIAIVSGRSLRDIYSVVDIKGVFYVGNHGLEILDPKGERTSLIPPESQDTLNAVRTDLQDQIDLLGGVFLEDKGAILAFHYRQASLSEQAALWRMLLDAEAKHSDVLELTFGKMVMEIRPRCAVNKGTAVDFLREVAGRDAFPIYIGDDLTDADAFRVIKGQGLAVQVGEAKLPVAGDYRVDDPNGVAHFLRSLCRHFSIGGF